MVVTLETSHSLTSLLNIDATYKKHRRQTGVSSEWRHMEEDVLLCAFPSEVAERSENEGGAWGGAGVITCNLGIFY